MSRDRSEDAGPQSFDIAADELRSLGRLSVELMLEALAAEQATPVLRPVDGAQMRALVDEPLPRAGMDVEPLLRLWQERILPYARRNGHPRFFGYVCTSADPLGMLADLLASAMNQPVTAWRSAPSATEIERLVVRWLDELTGFGSDGEGGILVSGGSAANFHALACAVVDAERRAELAAGRRDQLVVYMSTEAHVSLRKAARLLGVPEVQIRRLSVDSARRLRVDGLQEAIEADRRGGLVPAAVCASAGTANTGTVDPLGAIAEVCATEAVWFHVDGSYGAPAVMIPEYAWMAEAFARADSMSLDPHKWLFAPADAGCVLVRDVHAARRAFTQHSEYTEVTQTAPVESYAFFDHGLEMSRRFRGLKIWMILKARGADAIAAWIEQDIALRQHLDARVRAEPALEALGSELSISCFRYAPDHLRGEDLDRANRQILETLVGDGSFYLSPTSLDGRYALRVCIVNFRTSSADLDALVDEVLRIGSGLS